MKVKADRFPIYVNPDWNETIEITKAQPDNLRVIDNDQYFAVASGYGNNHTTIMRTARKYVRFGTALIFYKECGEWFLNMIDVEIEGMDNERLTMRELRDGLVGQSLYEFLVDFIGQQGSA